MGKRMVQQLYIKDWFGKPLRMDKDLRDYKYGFYHFLLLMCRRMNERRSFQSKDSHVLMDEVKSNFYSLGIEWADDGYEWTPNAAFELADEFASYDS